MTQPPAHPAAGAQAAARDTVPAPFPASPRRDYAFPLYIDPASRQVATCGYSSHVDQMIRQLLLTAPGERVNLPQFGCGLRQLVFAPASDAMAATLQIRIQANLQQWLGDQIQVADVALATGGDGEPAAVEVTVTYILIDTQTTRRLTITAV